MRILVVDDNADAAEMLATALELFGHEARFAVDGASALGIAEEWQAAVALLDLTLPDIDGFDLAARLRARWPAIALVAVTGHGLDDDRERTREAGFADHLLKPVGLDALRDLVTRLER